MKKTCAFFGHRTIYEIDKVREKLIEIVESLILDGCEKFIIGHYGDFDSLALSVCRELRKNYNIEIIVIFTSLYPFKKDEYGESYMDLYNDVSTSSYFIENEYYKNRIIVNNRFMIDDSDIVVCFVDSERYISGAKRAMNYAKRTGKKVINFYF